MEVSELITAFSALTQRTDSDDLLAISDEKLRLIQRFNTIINNHIPLRLRPKPLDEKSSDALLQQTCRQIFYQFLLVFGLFQDALGSYLFWSALFILIPSISNPVLIIASLAATALSSILYYAFQVTFLKDAFDLPQDHTHLGLLLSNYSLQLETTTAINEMLSSIWMLPIDNAIYDEYIQLLTLLNQDLRCRHAAMGAYTETAFKKVLKSCTLAFGALASIASSYFTVHLLMSLVAAPLLGTPIGWVILILTVVADLGYYYAMGATSMARLINPDLDHYQTFKNNLDDFNSSYPDDLTEIRTIKQQHYFFKEQLQSDFPLVPFTSVYGP